MTIGFSATPLYWTWNQKKRKFRSELFRRISFATFHALVYKLYGLTEEEIKIVEENAKRWTA